MRPHRPLRTPSVRLRHRHRMGQRRLWHVPVRIRWSPRLRCLVVGGGSRKSYKPRLKAPSHDVHLLRVTREFWPFRHRARDRQLRVCLSEPARRRRLERERRKRRRSASLRTVGRWLLLQAQAQQMHRRRWRRRREPSTGSHRILSASAMGSTARSGRLRRLSEALELGSDSTGCLLWGAVFRKQREFLSPRRGQRAAGSGLLTRRRTEARSGGATAFRSDARSARCAMPSNPWSRARSGSSMRQHARLHTLNSMRYVQCEIDGVKEGYTCFELLRQDVEASRGCGLPSPRLLVRSLIALEEPWAPRPPK